jgi:hypothetical protein
MITCLLVRINRDQQGHAVREEHLIHGDELSTGRGEECTIHLDDPRANLHVASIKCSKDGAFLIDGEGTLLNIDGMYEHSANLAQGSRILLGPYEFVVEKIGGDHDLVISVELIHPLPYEGEATKKIAPRSLSETELSIRKSAYWLAVITMVVFLLAPLVASLSSEFRSAMAHSGIFPNQLWNPRMVSPGHSSFGAQCFRCHESPFRPVRSETCLSCHKETRQHIANIEIEKHAFKGVGCSECHRDHQDSPIALQHAGVCIQCHANIKAKQADADIPDIHDFSTDHPAFKLSFKAGIDASDVRRVSQADTRKLVENSELKFPHDQHIGLVVVPWNRKAVRDIKCVECHQADEAGERFKPINMKQHCYECHQDQLKFKLAPEGRKLPHGSEEEVSNTLRDYYAGLAFRNKKTMEWVDEQLAKTTQSLLAGGGCEYCHTVEQAVGSNRLLKITPLQLTQNWFPASKFPHAKHQVYKCAECHEIENSEKSSDVAIPAIQSCKKCHTGTQPIRGKVTSSCISCHTFHSNMHISPAHEK